MTIDASRPAITLSPDTWPPRFLASSFAITVAYDSPASAAANGSAFVAALRGRLAGLWHVEPTESYGSPRFIVGLSPIFEDPADETARGLHAEALTSLLTGLGSCPDAVRLVDWGLTPTRQRLGEHVYFGLNDPLIFAARADTYAILRVARMNWLAPWLDGNRLVRNLAAFRELHVDMPDDEAFLAAIIWSQGQWWERQQATGRVVVAATGLIERGWVERTRSTYNQDTILSKTRRFAYRLPQVEALAY